MADRRGKRTDKRFVDIGRSSGSAYASTIRRQIVRGDNAAASMADLYWIKIQEATRLWKSSVFSRKNRTLTTSVRF
jgi:hypothetical protein